jgi:hypothetical protein
MVFIDTSIWIDFFANRSTKGTLALVEAIENEDLATCGVVITEVLQGVKQDKLFKKIKSILLDLIILPMTDSIYINAAQIYRSCRKMGISIRNSVDCMIAATCMEHSTFILHSDRDFDYISKHFPLHKYSIN